MSEALPEPTPATPDAPDAAPEPPRESRWKRLTDRLEGRYANRQRTSAEERAEVYENLAGEAEHTAQTELSEAEANREASHHRFIDAAGQLAVQDVVRVRGAARSLNLTAHTPGEERQINHTRVSTEGTRSNQVPSPVLFRRRALLKYNNLGPDINHLRNSTPETAAHMAEELGLGPLHHRPQVMAELAYNATINREEAAEPQTIGRSIRRLLFGGNQPRENHVTIHQIRREALSRSSVPVHDGESYLEAREAFAESERELAEEIDWLSAVNGIGELREERNPETGAVNRIGFRLIQQREAEAQAQVEAFRDNAPEWMRPYLHTDHATEYYRHLEEARDEEDRAQTAFNEFMDSIPNDRPPTEFEAKHLGALRNVIQECRDRYDLMNGGSPTLAEQAEIDRVRDDMLQVDIPRRQATIALHHASEGRIGEAPTLEEKRTNTAELIHAARNYNRTLAYRMALDASMEQPLYGEQSPADYAAAKVMEARLSLIELGKQNHDFADLDRMSAQSLAQVLRKNGPLLEQIAMGHGRDINPSYTSRDIELLQNRLKREYDNAANQLGVDTYEEYEALAAPIGKIEQELRKLAGSADPEDIKRREGLEELKLRRSSIQRRIEIRRAAVRDSMTTWVEQRDRYQEALNYRVKVQDTMTAQHAAELLDIATTARSSRANEWDALQANLEASKAREQKATKLQAKAEARRKRAETHRQHAERFAA